MIFYLGTHNAAWLWCVDFPLFISRRRLESRKSFQRAKCRWALDSGAFTEIQKFGRWELSPSEYVDQVHLFSGKIGPPDFVAIQDWMCEPPMLKRTGLTIEQHQTNTLKSYLQLNFLAPTVPWLPILQGWRVTDYLRHYRMYQNCGVNLPGMQVGVGSVCKRQGSREIVELFEELAPMKMRLHGFGVKTLGLKSLGPLLESADSMAWSFTARRTPVKLEGCLHKNCANCLKYAIQWRNKLLGGN